MWFVQNRLLLSRTCKPWEAHWRSYATSKEKRRQKLICGVSVHVLLRVPVLFHLPVHSVAWLDLQGEAYVDFIFDANGQIDIFNLARVNCQFERHAADLDGFEVKEGGK